MLNEIKYDLHNIDRVLLRYIIELKNCFNAGEADEKGRKESMCGERVWLAHYEDFEDGGGGV